MKGIFLMLLVVLFGLFAWNKWGANLIGNKHEEEKKA